MAIGRISDLNDQAEAALAGLGDEGLLDLFIDGADQEAFEVLVARHGPRVLGVCRRILHRTHDAEDIFQATFLLLARNATKIRKRDCLGPWLCGVAHRLAVRAKAQASHRAVVERERPGAAMAGVPPEDDMDRRDIRRVIHEELERLPERLRQPLLLCYLEGLSNEEAAQYLECPLGTLKTRLAKAREILQGRLARRGVALSAALFVLLLGGTAPAADVPRRLIRSTVAAAMAAARARDGSVALAYEARRCLAPSRGPAPDRFRRLAETGTSPPRRRHPVRMRVPLFALTTLAIGIVATLVLYYTSPQRDGFVSWILGSARWMCH
jgi:RNA polymerase sigma factor (sigma-70 family)